jgi:hypothetical protein
MFLNGLFLLIIFNYASSSVIHFFFSFRLRHLLPLTVIILSVNDRYKLLLMIFWLVILCQRRVKVKETAKRLVLLIYDSDEVSSENKDRYHELRIEV